MFMNFGDEVQTKEAFDLRESLILRVRKVPRGSRAVRAGRKNCAGALVEVHSLGEGRLPGVLEVDNKMVHLRKRKPLASLVHQYR